jgi:Protein of unknown function (DUF1573)
MRLQLLGSVVGVLFFLVNAAYTEDKITKSESIKSVNGNLAVRFNLGELQCDRKYKLELELLNNFNTDFAIQKIQTTCSCVNAVLRENRIPAGGSTYLDMELSTEKPDKVNDAKRNYVIYIFYGEQESVNLIIEYSLAGLVSFKGASSFLTKAVTKSRTHSFEVPVLITAPVNEKNLLISSGEQFKEFKGTFVQKDGNQWVACRIAIPENFEKSIIERLTIEDPLSKQKAELPVIVEVRSRIAITPSVVQFVAEENDRQYKGRIVMRLDESILGFSDDGKRNEFAPNISLDCKTGAMKIASQERMGIGVYRIELAFTPNQNVQADVDGFPEVASMSVATQVASLVREFGVRFAKK